jgi:hypothetical protein
VRALFIVLRILVPVAVIAAVIGQLVTSIAFWTDRGVTNIGSNIVNFLSFFTIDSNILSAVVLLIGAALLARRIDDPHWFLVARLCVVTYMITTGVVYYLLLRGIELPQGSTLGWSNEILHVVVPVYLLVDWLLAPGRRPVRWRAIWIVVVFPLVWSIYTLVRGPLVVDQVYGTDFWYPYPFMNPNAQPAGYGSVALYMLAITVLIALAGLGTIAVSRRKRTISS